VDGQKLLKTELSRYQIEEVKIASVDYKSALLFQLEDLILNFNPVWGSVLLKGKI
jgi:hypothetical protein